MSSAAIATPIITVEKLQELDEIDLRAFTSPILIQGGDEDADLPLAVLIPYATFAAWQETIDLATRFSEEMSELLQRANAALSQTVIESREERQKQKEGAV